jgi:hypothetical protein
VVRRNEEVMKQRNVCSQCSNPSLSEHEEFGVLNVLTVLLRRTVGLRVETKLILMQPATPDQKLHSRAEPFVPVQTSKPPSPG